MRAPQYKEGTHVACITDTGLRVVGCILVDGGVAFVHYVDGGGFDDTINVEDAQAVAELIIDWEGENAGS